MEQWIPLKNFPGYAGSSEGRIKNLKTQRILTSVKNDKGRSVVTLKCNGRYMTVKVDRVIADAFNGTQSNLDIWHKDRDRLNNRPDNLEWCTRQETISRRRRRTCRD